MVVLDAAQAEVEPGEYVEVQGTVRQPDIAEPEDEFGTDLDDAHHEEDRVGQEVSRPTDDVAPQSAWLAVLHRSLQRPSSSHHDDVAAARPAVASAATHEEAA